MTEKTYIYLKRICEKENFDTSVFKDWSKFVDIFNFFAEANDLDKIDLNDWECIRRLVRAKLLKEMPAPRIYYIDEYGFVTTYNPALV